MFPVPALAKQLELEWSAELAAHLGCSESELRGAPTRHLDYPSGGVRVELMDGSFVQFKWAFAVVSETRKAIAVFTEHCGHHVYPNHEARIIVEGKVVYEQTAV